MAAATLCALAAVHAPLERVLLHQQATAVGAALLLCVALATIRVPSSWRRGPVAASSAVGVLVVLAVGEVVAETVAGPLTWLDNDTAWTRQATGPARSLLGTAWTGSWYVPLTLGLLVMASVTVIVRLPRSRPALAALGAPAALAAATVLTVPLAADAPYLSAVAAGIASGCVLAVVGARQRRPVPGIALATTGAVLVGHGLVWSLAARTATLLALGLALAGALAAFAADRRASRPLPVAAVALLAVAGAYVALRALDAPADRAGFGAVVVAGIVGVGAGLLARPVERLAVEASAVIAGVAAFVPVLDDPGWTSHTLLAAGVATALVAVRADRHQVGWASGLLLTLSSWVRLAIEDVNAPEAYTAGPPSPCSSLAT
jgi:hypothetical protein